MAKKDSKKIFGSKRKKYYEIRNIYISVFFFCLNSISFGVIISNNR